ncbi:hypothetical protein Q5H93_10420 [Hymenobacter sp. ASUV-10]|uniref:Uncharacterized protein n=1 Tax=Hymenobacter aranciens TaxID=3063996 RepID=A0ABT9BA51_9BACT|nr:hypothetical protein [Hymenobacter sp. ASUV-10]MDO7875146.1 hypothetical protein [Hymenobacter sp. ASUV-10]
MVETTNTQLEAAPASFAPNGITSVAASFITWGAGKLLAGAGGKFFSEALIAFGIGSEVEVNKRLDAIIEDLALVKKSLDTANKNLIEISKQLKMLAEMQKYFAKDAQLMVAWSSIVSAHGVAYSAAELGQEAPAEVEAEASNGISPNMMRLMTQTKGMVFTEDQAKRFAHSVDHDWRVKQAMETMRTLMTESTPTSESILQLWTNQLLLRIENHSVTVPEAYSLLEAWFADGLNRLYTGAAVLSAALAGKVDNPRDAAERNTVLTREVKKWETEFKEDFVLGYVREFQRCVDVLLFTPTFTVAWAPVSVGASSAYDGLPAHIEPVILQADLFCAAVELRFGVDERNAQGEPDEAKALARLKQLLAGIYGRALVRTSQLEGRKAPAFAPGSYAPRPGRVTETAVLRPRAIDLTAARDNFPQLQDKMSSQLVLASYFWPWEQPGPALHKPFDANYRYGVQPQQVDLFQDGQPLTVAVLVAPQVAQRASPDQGPAVGMHAYEWTGITKENHIVAQAVKWGTTPYVLQDRVRDGHYLDLHLVENHNRQLAAAHDRIRVFTANLFEYRGEPALLALRSKVHLQLEANETVTYGYIDPKIWSSPIVKVYARKVRSGDNQVLIDTEHAENGKYYLYQKLRAKWDPETRSKSRNEVAVTLEGYKSFMVQPGDKWELVVECHFHHGVPRRSDPGQPDENVIRLTLGDTLLHWVEPKFGETVAGENFHFEALPLTAVE